MLRIYNSLTRKVEEFAPLNPPHVGIYACGPTVYDRIHIGNLRSFIFYDVLRRTLTTLGYDVTFVQNITDVEDKIIKRSAERGITPQELTEEYTKYFLDDISKVNILPANVRPKATEHIGAMIKYIEDLIEKGLAYVEKDGSVYFDISEFPEYGKLSQIEKRELKTGTRMLSDEYSKDDVQDFALWKGVETSEFGWDSPWGKGRPGWHIECSVMSQEYLGETFDIHTGGIDLLFPHHENEIAQAEGKTGHEFVKYWVHGEHLLVDGKKMSKSLNNFYTWDDVAQKGFTPEAFRYLMLTSHYRDKINFTWESLQAAQNALNNLREIVREWPASTVILGREATPESESSVSDSGQVPPMTGSRLSGARVTHSEISDIALSVWSKFIEALSNDLNTAQAVAVMWEFVRDQSIEDSVKSELLTKMDEVFGLGLVEYIGKQVEIPEQVQELVEEREVVRNNKDWPKSDELRDEIKKLGFEVKDTPEGPRLSKI
jgi:cysteinyl-tRNA synthetase